MTAKKVPTKIANFKVDTRLAVLLGEDYPNTERALKELIDNAWDADAENIRVTIPPPMTTAPVIVADDGSGMTAQELDAEYLFIANDRRSRKGELTSTKRRKVKGKKGVGKFAGLCAASVMAISSKARGTETSVTIDRKTLESIGVDIERVPLQLTSQQCAAEEHGTTIELSSLDQTINFPNPEKLRNLLMRDYGREEGVSIYVNDKILSMDDLGGPLQEVSSEIENAGPVRMRFIVADDKERIKGAGIVVRVKGAVIGRPSFLGLDKAEDFPKSLLSKIYGEIEADGLERDTTADLAAIVGNSVAFKKVQEWAAPLVREQVRQVYAREMQLAQARLKQKINRRLAELPEFKRQFAEGAINRLLHRFYGESEERLEPIVNVVLDALERDDYRLIIEELDRTKDSDVALFAEALGQFGLVDLAIIAHQAQQRLRFLDFLEQLCEAPGTDESAVHRAIEQNLWILGNQYGLMASNRTLKAIVESVLGGVYTGARASERPDLLLAENIQRQHVVVEFKAPSVPLNYDHYQQATRYRHELGAKLSGVIEVIVIGKSIDQAAAPAQREPNVQLVTYHGVISAARSQLNWLLAHLKQEEDS